MARGRIIVSKICSNKAVSQLSDDTSRLALTWLFLYADEKWLVSADPLVVQSLVFPRRRDTPSVEKVAEYIQEWIDAGLVTTYEYDGEQRLDFQCFLHADRRLGQSIRAWRASVLKRDWYRCQECNAVGVKLHAHHIVPVCVDRSQTFDIENGVTLCRKCHRKHHAIGWQQEWRR